MEPSEPNILSLRRIFSQATFYFQLYGLAFLITLALCWVIANSGHELQPLEARDYSLRRCELTSSVDKPVLRVLDAVYNEDRELMNIWCQTTELATHYSALEFRSVHRDSLDLRELYESRYDLVLAKPELIERVGQANGGGVGYQMIARYPEYGSQLVSLQGTPELNARWMKGKTLGLLDDPNSISAYQIPRAALQNSGLTDDPTLIYFRSHRQLYHAMFEGRVDVIAALLSDEGPTSALQLPPGLVLQRTIPGPAWYINQQLHYSPQHCSLQAALKQLALNAKYDYLRNLQLVGSCSAD